MLNELNVSRETIDRLKQFELLLKKWNKSYNLISRQEEDIWGRHILDSIQLIQHLDKNDKILDIGSGAGFPAIILGICGYDVIMVESNKKKCAFLTIAKSLCSGKVHIINERIEDIKTQDINLITARGFSNLDKLFANSQNICQSNCRYLLLKGQSYKDEILLAKGNWQFDFNEFDSLTDDSGKIIEILNLKKL